MSEILRGDPWQPQSRREQLRGQIPDTFLRDLASSGLAHDYGNIYTSTLLSLGAIRGGIPIDIQELRSFLSTGTPTYTEYWQIRINDFNERARAKKKKQIDGTRTMQLLVTEQPETEVLDSIALQVRDLVNNPAIAFDELVPQYVRYAAQAVGILRQSPTQERRILAQHGLAPKGPGESAE